MSVSPTMLESQIINEDSVTVPPYNLSDLISDASTTMLAARKTLEKPQDLRLKESIGEYGKVGAVIYIQNVETGKIDFMSNKFYLQAMQIEMKEKVQIMETFGAPVAAFFGNSAKVYSFSGVAVEWASQTSGLNTWHGTSLLWLYENYMRGSKLVQNNRICIMKLLNHSIYGYPLQFNYRSASEFDKAVQFSFSMFVKDHLYTDEISVKENSIKINNQSHLNSEKLAQHISALEDITESIGAIENLFEHRYLTGETISEDGENMIPDKCEAVTQAYCSRITSYSTNVIGTNKLRDEEISLFSLTSYPGVTAESIQGDNPNAWHDILKTTFTNQLKVHGDVLFGTTTATGDSMTDEEAAEIVAVNEAEAFINTLYNVKNKINRKRQDLAVQIA